MIKNIFDVTYLFKLIYINSFLDFLSKNLKHLLQLIGNIYTSDKSLLRVARRRFI